MSTTQMTHPGAAKTWLMAARPKTLAAAAVPVVVGTAVAASEGAFGLLPALAALVGAGLIQIGTNLANDYFDHKSGADNDDRLGPTRVVQSGLIEAHAVKRAAALTFGLAALVGVYLVALAGWPILVIGLASILSGVAYTGGPFPLGYNGLGDVFVFVFFGLAATAGTHYVQALSWSPEALIAAVPVGLLSTAILVVNNYRDIDTDRAAGKRTLAVRLGPKTTRWQYALLVGGAYALPLIQWIGLEASAWLLLPLATAPLAALRLRAMWTQSGAQLNALLAQTAQLLAIFGLLYAVGYLL